MPPSERVRGWHCPAVVAGALVISLTACGEKSPPEPAAKPIPPAAQPEPRAALEKEEKASLPPQQPLAVPVNANTELAAKVKSALGVDGGINVHRIDVAAEAGVVTLYGTTDTADQRARAERIAAGVSGVKSVQNKLAIVAGS